MKTELVRGLGLRDNQNMPGTCQAHCGGGGERGGALSAAFDQVSLAWGFSVFMLKSPLKWKNTRKRFILRPRERCCAERMSFPGF